MISNIHDIKILGLVDLLDCDHNSKLLKDRLKSLYKSYYQPNEKIVILHFDTEYFYHGHPLGFTTHNLFSIWRDLDIPFSAMLLLHNYSNINLAIEPFIVSPNDRPTTINLLVNHYSLGQVKHWVDSPMPNKNIQYHAVCLMSTIRSHRIALMKYLTHKNLLDKIKTNFSVAEQNNYLGASKKNSHIASIAETSPDHTVYSKPFRNNESVFQQSRIPEIVELFPVSVQPYQDAVLLGDFDNFYHLTFLDVVTETLFDIPHVFISEKTLRPLITETPFVVFGAAGTLAHLRSFGFKTFDKFWDESYDNEQDPHLRFLSCCRTIEYVAGLSLNDLKSCYLDMYNILQHNRKVLIDYIKNQYYPLNEKIKFYDLLQNSVS